jgi:hypothetical protein
MLLWLLIALSNIIFLTHLSCYYNEMKGNSPKALRRCCIHQGLAVFAFMMNWIGALSAHSKLWLCIWSALIFISIMTAVNAWKNYKASKS